MPVILLFLLVLTGCMKTSDLAYEGRYQLADAGLLDRHHVERAHNLRIERDALIYIVQSHFPPVDRDPDEVEANILALETYKAFVEYFPRMRRSPVPLGLDEAFAAAAQERADYLLYVRLAQAQDRKLMDKAVIQFMLYDRAHAYLLDNAHIPVRSGLLTSRHNRPEDFLREPMLDYARRLQGLGGYPH
ncbi:DUF4823 domain-containing protein [Thiopseudomonas denitrificans]|uniref:Uncharacterized protein DUF4823 n=1 Tax=Thiopseudomonas denitrificans TaxID=1501432 RepID=A0A4R6UAH6_9GAMM|nr:DUF4823 domain-containing protein [Thiopseudomonas denitrificans]TDQ40074.1 uncharacterized protein DUF4823 [Thiopseudomonas denitrificans]